METGKSKSEERSQLLTDPIVTSIAYEINKANKSLNQHRLQVSTWHAGIHHCVCMPQRPAYDCLHFLVYRVHVLDTNICSQKHASVAAVLHIYSDVLCVSQVLLRWALQYGVGAVCEAAGKSIDRANVGVFEWSLSDADFKKLSNIKPS